MSKRGRPQFLPPEDPPPPPPPSAPPPRDGRGPLIAVGGALAAVAVAGLATLLYETNNTWKNAAATPTPSASMSAEPPTPSAPPFGAPTPSMPPLPGIPQPGFTVVPDLCGLSRDDLPADVRSVKPKRLTDSCQWRILRTDRSRSLDVELKLEKDSGSAGAGTLAAVKDYADDLAYAADPARNGGFAKHPEQLAGVGDEAFAAESFNTIVYGGSEKSAKQYDMGGAMVEARLRNVIVTVKWRGADYPSSVRVERNLSGRRLRYPVARQEALTVLQAVLAKVR